MDAQLQQEINVLIRKLDGLGRDVLKNAKDDLKEGGSLIVSALKGRVPVGNKVHKRYKSGRKKAAKGQGNVVATYRPGNLKRAYRILALRRMKTGIMIGPKLGGAVDGYYVHMVNNAVTFKNGTTRAGKHFVEAAIQAAGDPALRAVVDMLKQRVLMYADKNYLNK